MQQGTAMLYEHESAATLHNFYSGVKSPTTLHKKYKFQLHFNS